MKFLILIWARKPNNMHNIAWNYWGHGDMQARPLQATKEETFYLAAVDLVTLSSLWHVF